MDGYVSPYWAHGVLRPGDMIRTAENTSYLFLIPAE